MRSKLFLIILCILALMGGSAVLFASNHGIGLYPDSVTYILASRTFLAGQLFKVLSPDGTLGQMTHYPPFFPVVLSISHLWGQDPLPGARWISAFLFMGNIIFTGITLKKAIPSSILFPVFGGFMVLISAAELPEYLVCLSEALFIFLVLSGFYFLILYLNNNRRWLLMAVSITFGLAWLTRYAGIAFIFSTVLCLIFLQSGLRKDKLKRTLFFIGMSGFPMMGWLIYNYVTVGNGTDRSFAFHPLGSEQLRQMGATLASWFLPEEFITHSTEYLVLFLICIFVFGAGFFLWRKIKSEKVTHPGRMTVTTQVFISSGFFIIIYVLFIILSITFVDFYTPLDTRILSPIFIPLLLILVIMGYSFWNTIKVFRVARPLLFVITLVFVIFFSLRGASLVIDSHNHGLGFSSTTWVNSAIIADIRKIPADQPIMTNDAALIYTWTGRFASSIPASFDPSNLLPISTYQNQLNNQMAKLKENKGWIAWFDESAWYLPGVAEIENKWPLTIVFNRTDGKLYQVDYSH